MEWVDGVKLTDKGAMAAAGLNVVDFVDVGIECTLRQLLEHGYFHADPQCVGKIASVQGSPGVIDPAQFISCRSFAPSAILSLPPMGP